MLNKEFKTKIGNKMPSFMIYSRLDKRLIDQIFWRMAEIKDNQVKRFRIELGLIP